MFPNETEKAEVVQPGEKKRLLGDFRATSQYLKGTYKKAGEVLVTRAWSMRRRENGFETEG